MRRTRPGLEPRETRGTELIAYAYEQPAREDRDRVIAEIKKLLASYCIQRGNKTLKGVPHM